jgi:predicted NBD/HSP70 family sugar kinase
VACDLKGREIWSTKLILQKPNATNAMETMLEAIDRFRGQYKDDYSRLLGIGIAAPGPFGPSNISDEITSFRELGFQSNIDMLCAETGLPVILENDAAAAAVGEYIYGEGANFDSFVFMQFGLGIGAGFILNGIRYHGFAKNAGEIGHIIIEPGGHNCSCGNQGCLEQYLSLNSLCRHIGISPFDNDIDDLISERIENGDPAVSDWLDMAADKFRQVINILEVLVDSEVIIVGGTAPKSFLSQLIMRSQPLFSPLTDGKSKARRVLLGAAGANTVALGAAAASLDTHFAPSVSQLLL